MDQVLYILYFPKPFQHPCLPLRLAFSHFTEKESEFRKLTYGYKASKFYS